MASSSLPALDSLRAIREAGRARPIRRGNHATRNVAGFRFAFPRPASADVHVADMEGRRVRTLARGMLSAGEHECGWNGLDDAGARCPPGRYVLRLETGGSLLTSRVVQLT